MRSDEGALEARANDGFVNSFLRELAGYPSRSVVMGRTRVNSSVTWIERDGNGRVIGSMQRIEVSEVENLDGQWND